MIKLALISFKYPPVYSGYGKQLQLITEDVLSKHTDVEINLLTAYDESLKSTQSNLKITSLLQRNNDDNSKSVFPFSIEVFKWLVRNRDTYEVIHCIKAGPEAIACNFASKILKKPLIVKVAQDELSDQEINDVKGLKKATRLLRHRLLKNSNYFIAISEEIKKNLKKRIGEKSKIIRIPNGVNNQVKFRPANADEKNQLRSSLSIEQDEKLLLYTGAVNKRKGIHDLLDALLLYSNKVPLRVVICGPILEDINFENRVKGINENDANIIIDYRGKVSNMEDYMRAADMFILPSYSEGLPNVLLEAGATGLPLIATDIGGSRDIVINGVNGYIISTHSPSEIHDAINSLINDDAKRELMGKESRMRVSNFFALDHVSDAYYKLYKNLSNNV